MPQFDHEKLLKLVSEIRKSVLRLQKLKELGRDKFINDPDKIGSAKYHFIDDARIYSILEDHLGDLKKFIDSIALFLEWQNDSFSA